MYTPTPPSPVLPTGTIHVFPDDDPRALAEKVPFAAPAPATRLSRNAAPPPPPVSAPARPAISFARSTASWSASTLSSATSLTT
eukprot:scaffold2470_cov91-Isochrysis_galbana.AAC.2